MTTKECVGHRRNKECPIENKKCNLQNNIYNAQIITHDKTYNYIGMSAPPLRLRVATHVQSFKSESNQTELSGKIKELEKNGTQYEIKFKLIENKNSYSPESKRCQLCTAESYYILYSNLGNLLNKKSEIISKCRHKTKFKLGSYG